jgi:regulatory protein
MATHQLSLKGRALRLLGAREHSRAELERKLARFEEVPGSLAQALDELEAKGFISAQRVIASLLHRRAGKLGNARLRQELQQKGLEPALVGAAMVDLQGSEAERALAVWRKKFGTPAADVQEAARQARFLATRGFAAETIRRVVSGRHAMDDQD